MKKIITTILILFSFSIYAQSDLKSLYEQFTGKKIGSGTNTGASTNSAFQAEELEIDTMDISELETDSLEEELSYFERYVRGEIINPYEQDSLIYTYKFDFSKVKPHLLSNTQKIPGNYLVSPGDQLIIEIWGSINESYNITMNNDGYFIIPTIGKIDYFGLDYDGLKKAVSSKLKNISGIQFACYLANIQPIQVFVTGQVNNPGFYYVSPFANILEILAAAGGTTEYGSLRDVKVRSNNEKHEIDIYNFLFTGEKMDVSFKSKDIIHVPFKAGQVAITGNVKNQAIFESKPKEKLQEILSFANLTPYADKQNIEIERLTKTGRKKIISTSFEENPEIFDGDIIRVFSSLVYNAEYIYLKGNFRQSGKKEFVKNMTLKDIFKTRDMVYEDTYFDYAKIIRQSGYGKRNSVISFSLDSVFNHNQDADIAIFNQDTIVTFKIDSLTTLAKINVFGEVKKPGDYDFYDGMKIFDAIEQAGGLTEKAYLDTVEIFNKLTEAKTRIDYKKSGKSFRLSEEDNIFIKKDPRFNAKKVKIFGKVKYPGEYVIANNDTYFSVLAKCQGYTNDANPRGLQLYRESVKAMQEKRIKKLQKELREKVTALAFINQDTDYLNILNNQNMDSIEVEGRMVIALKNNMPQDFMLTDGDSIYIPTLDNTIHVTGEVLNPSSFVINGDNDYEFYLKKTGGLSPFSDYDNVIIIGADGNVVKNEHSWFFGNSLAEHKLKSGDMIYVPYDYTKGENLEVTKDVALILSNLSTAIYNSARSKTEFDK